MLSLTALAFPAAAQAHHPEVSVDCAGVLIKYVDYPKHSGNEVHVVVKVDNTVVADGTHTFNGRTAYKHIPLTIYGNHKVTVFTEWDTNGVSGSNKTETDVMCGAPPPPPPPAVAPPPPPPPPAPASAVQGVQVTSPARPAAAVARLNTRSSCRSKVVRTTVRGSGMRRVTFSVNGRRVKTMKVRSGKRKVSTNLRRRSRNTQAITVRVRFANGRTRTLTARASRCAQAQVQPQFTG